MLKSWRRSWQYSPVHSCKEADLGDDTLQPAPNSEPLSDRQSVQDANALQYRTRLRRAAIFGLAISGLIASIVVILVIVRPFKRPVSRFSSEGFNLPTRVSSPSKTNKQPHLCGNSSAQARELGCTFHQLTWSWLPPDCPSYANGEFMQAAERPWVFYEDLEATKIAEGEVWEQVLNGELRVFGERREHVTHCVFMFLSMAEIIRDRSPYHAKLGDYGHMKHCAGLVLDIVRKSPDWNDLDTFAGTVSFDQHCRQSKVSPMPVTI